MSKKRAKISKNYCNAPSATAGLRAFATPSDSTFELFCSPNYFFCVTGRVSLNKYPNYLINKVRYLTVRHAPPKVVTTIG